MPLAVSLRKSGVTLTPSTERARACLSVIGINDSVERLNNWRAGIADTIAAKVAKERYAGHDLCFLVYARGCTWENIDTSFIDIAEPAITAVENWQSVFNSVYVVDDRECACFG